MAPLGAIDPTMPLDLAIPKELRKLVRFGSGVGIEIGAKDLAVDGSVCGLGHVHRGARGPALQGEGHQDARTGGPRVHAVDVDGKYLE